MLKGEFVTMHVESEEQHADFLTKLLYSAGFRHHRDCVVVLLELCGNVGKLYLVV